jgi:hypothetical protein
MTEPDERDEAARRYRELPQEEPPAALDAAIRAHARRAVARRQWYVPAAAAAILVLAVAVTWQVEREQPDMVAVTSAPPAPPKAVVEEKAKDSTGEKELAKQQAPASAPAPMQAPAEMRADQAQPRPQVGAAARSEMMAKRGFAETPEQWLERVAKLRAEGRHEEADKALEEFRKRHPDFKIPGELLKKLER